MLVWQMISCSGILFCFILVNSIGGSEGSGQKVDNNGNNDNGKKVRKAFEANWRHNGKEERVKKEVKREPKEENEENKLWKKVKREPPIDVQLKEEGEEIDGKKLQKIIKKEPKIEKNEWEEDLVSKSTDELDERLDKIYKANKENQTKNAISNNETKLEIIKEFDKMRNKYKKNGKYKSNDRVKIEEKIAKELGTFRHKIYEWKRELINRERRRAKSEEEKWEKIEKFDKMKKEYQMRNDYKHEDRYKIEKEIANALGTHRNKIYEWKKELNQRKKLESEEKWEKIEKFYKMKKEYQMRNDYKHEHRAKIEKEIAKALGTHRNKIYEWKKEFIQRRKAESEERNRELIKEFDRMRKEYKRKKKYKNEDRFRIEREIARELGTYRTNIYQWKKALAPSQVHYTTEQKRAIIAKFDNLCVQFSRKFNRNTTKRIEEKIAQKIHTCRKSICRWRKAFETQ